MSTRNTSLNLRASRWALAATVATLAGLAAPALHAAPPDGPRHGMMGGGHGGPGGMMMGLGSDRMLDAVNATADQRTQIRQIMDAAHADLKAQREAGRALHDQLRQAFVQPTVDARTVEALRQQQVAQHDAASRRMMQAMLDVSRVLTPEQRARIAEHMAQRRAQMERRAPR